MRIKVDGRFGVQDHQSLPGLPVGGEGLLRGGHQAGLDVQQFGRLSDWLEVGPVPRHQQSRQLQGQPHALQLSVVRAADQLKY